TLTDSHSFSYTDTVPPELYTLSLHDALPICPVPASAKEPCAGAENRPQGRTHRCVEALSAERTGLAVTTTGASSGRVLRPSGSRSEEHTSELQSQSNLVCRLLLEKKKQNKTTPVGIMTSETGRRKLTSCTLSPIRPATGVS